MVVMVTVTVTVIMVADYLDSAVRLKSSRFTVLNHIFYFAVDVLTTARILVLKVLCFG